MFFSFALGLLVISLHFVCSVWPRRVLRAGWRSFVVGAKRGLYDGCEHDEGTLAHQVFSMEVTRLTT